MRTKTETSREVNDNIIGADEVSKLKGVFTARRGFFYTHGRTAEQLAQEVREAYPQAKILEQAEVWKPFKGGASLRSQSHWFVKFTL